MLLLLGSCSCFGQTVIRGTVFDSASFSTLSDVHISIRHTQKGTYTNELGKFVLVVDENDTLDFTRIGYYSISIAVIEIKAESSIKMIEKSTVLRPVTLVSEIEIPTLEIPKETIFKNSHIDVGNGIRNVFGLGISIPFYKIFENKEKKRIKELNKRNDLSKTYILVVTDPEIKQNIMTRYGLSEKEYYEILTIFNETNKNIMYAFTEIELITSLDNFFMINVPR